MSSTLRVTNVSDVAGGTSTNLMSGLAKAWASWEAQGTASIIASFNISSLTDNGTGLQDLNYTSTMSSNDYGFSACGDGSGAVSSARGQGSTASEYRAGTYNSSGTLTDAADHGMSVFGDLA